MTRRTKAVQTEGTKPAGKRITIAPGEPHKARLTTGMRIDMGNVPKPAITFIEPKRTAPASQGFTFPPSVFDAQGRKINYSADAKALLRFFLDKGHMPRDLGTSTIENTLKFAEGAVPGAYLRAFRLKRTASFQDVLDRLHDLGGRNLRTDKIAGALALPPEDHKGHEITWAMVLEAAGAQPAPVSTALGPVVQR